VKTIYLLIGMASIVPLQSNAGEMITAELYCSDTKEIVGKLKEKYRESPLLIGKTADQASSIMSLWINPNTKSWSIITTKGDVTCLVGSGGDFNLVDYTRKPTT